MGNLAVKVNAVGIKTRHYADKVYLYGLAFFLASQACFLTNGVSEAFYNLLFYIGTVLLAAAGIYRIIFTLFNDLKKALFAIAVVLFGTSYMIYSVLTVYSPDALKFLMVAVAIVGAMGVNADHILIAGIIGNLVMMINNVFTSFTVADELFDNTYAHSDFFYLGKNLFYFHRVNNSSSTDWAAHYFWIIAAYLWIRGKKLTWGEVFAVGALDVLVYSLTGSSTALICISLILVIAFIFKLHLFLKYRSGKNVEQVPGCRSSGAINVINKMFDFCSKYSFVIFAFFMILIIVLYDIGDPLTYRLNLFLHERLSLGHRGIVENGIHLFSSGVDVYGNFASIDGFYNFLDCSYVSVLVKMGMLPLVFYLGSMTAVQLKHKKYLYGSLLLAVCALSCVEEHHLAEIPYNFFLLLLFADYEAGKINNVPLVINRKKQSASIYSVASILLGIGFAVSAVAINYPRYRAVKECDRLDERATEIYCSVQKNLDALVESGEWQSKTALMSSYQYGDDLEVPYDFFLTTGNKWSEKIKDPKAHAYYSVPYDAMKNDNDYEVLELLISDEVRELINGGSAVIEYDVITGKVYSVWYSEKPGCRIIIDGRLEDRSGRLKMKESLEGYSTGESYE